MQLLFSSPRIFYEKSWRASNSRFSSSWILQLLEEAKANGAFTYMRKWNNEEYLVVVLLDVF